MHKFSKSFKGRFKKIINKPLHNFECNLSKLKANQNCLYPPIFIIGPPRSGSTLLYQAMTDYFDLGYLSNLHCSFYGAPSIVERIVHPLKWRKLSDYQSSYGRTSGLIAPSECGEFWYRFFPRNPPYVFNELSKEQLNNIRAVILKLGKSFGKPVVFKNVYNSVRLLPLSQALPEALFLVIKRDEIDNAHSILASRWKVLGDYNKWWSLELPETEALKKLPAHEQAVEQIRHAYRWIEDHKKKIGGERFFEVKYEDFCENPSGMLEKLNGFFQYHNVKVAKREELPERFKVSKKVIIEPELYEKMVDYVQAE